MSEKIQFAVLIDADNVSAKYASVIFEELEKYGFASCRRIYGNWSRGSGWSEELLLEYSIIPIQQFCYTTGKNSTDIAMVIDAMDLLYQDKAEGFCLVTSDSDFTRLAMRLREEKKYVLGMGESKTPLALTRACNKFIHLNLIDESNNEQEENDRSKTAGQNKDGGLENVTSLEDVEQAIWTLFRESGCDLLDLGLIGSRLNEKFTDFDVRNYGYTKLSVFLTEEMPHFKLIQKYNRSYLQKQGQPDRSAVEQDILSMLTKNGGMIDNLSMIYNDLKAKYGNFQLKDYGFNKMSAFLRSMDSLSVNANTVTVRKKKKKK